MAPIPVAWHDSRLLLRVGTPVLLVVVVLLADFSNSPALVSALPLAPTESLHSYGAARPNGPSPAKASLLLPEEATKTLRTFATQNHRTSKRSTLRNSEAPAHPIRHFEHRFNQIVEALNYLHSYGYLNAEALTVNTIESALKSFQQMAGITETGTLDRSTLKRMHAPRCGNRDVDDKPKKLTKVHEIVRRFAQVSKWSDKMDDNDVLLLKWMIGRPTDDIPLDQLKAVVKKAFKLWADQVSIPGARSLTLEFEEGTSDTDSDVSIVWAVGNHGDDYPFDGTGGTTNILAHTFYPNYQETGTLNGDIHFDDAENWVLDTPSASSNGVHFPYVLVHEIGHALGLGHSKSQDAVMNPIYKKQNLDSIALDIDDRCAVNWNYIGPTQTCLYVWLLVEVLPRAKESNISSHALGPGEQLSTGDSSLEARIQSTLDSLRQANIPLCDANNDIQAKYELLLEQKLELPPESARLYGPVVCNYFRGLSSAVQTQNSDTDHASPLVPALDIHTYHRMKRAVPLDGSDLNVANTDMLPETPSTNLYDPTYFNKDFFDRLLSLFAEKYTKKTRL